MNEASPKTYKEIQAVWLNRLEAASEKYRAASTIYRQAEQEYRAKAIPVPDGDLSLRNAAKQENEARSEYARTLRLFTDLLLNGTIPKEPPVDGAD